MKTDDISLRVGLLEIETPKPNKDKKEENPFITSLQRRNHSSPKKCLCHIQKKKYTVCKKKQNKVLREPVLKLSQNCITSSKNECCNLQRNFSESLSSNANDSICLHSLVDTCNQLYISTKTKKCNNKTPDINHGKWWQDKQYRKKQTQANASEKSSTSTCSQEALNPPCDVTIDELASYFETLVHIPKKMSSMAEMMYI